VIEINKTIRSVGTSEKLTACAGLLVLGISASAFATGNHHSDYNSGECVQDEPGASTVMISAGKQSCAKISGQFGCRVRFGEREYYKGEAAFGNSEGGREGRCTVYDDDEKELFTVVSEFDHKDGLSWRILDPTTQAPLAAKVNTVIVKSEAVKNGNACDYIYANEAVSGSGQGWLRSHPGDDVGKFQSSDGGYGGYFARVDAALFCTDGETDDTPTPNCDTLFDDESICSSFDGERFLISLDPNSPDWNPVECTCNEPEIWTSCDEDATEDGDKCTGDGPLKALPVNFEAGNDGTWICRTIGGVRKCWSR